MPNRLHRSHSFFVSTCAFLIYFCSHANPRIMAASNGYREAPCPFFHTVNVTGDPKFENGSYLHDGVLIPPHLVGFYNYEYIKDTAVENRVEVTPHWRGCICNLRPCINFCCPWGSIYNISDKTCRPTPKAMQWPEKKLTVTLGDASEREVNIFEQFAVINFRPTCEVLFVLQAESDEDPANAEFKLFDNGTELQMFPKRYLTKDEFCLAPTVDNDTSKIYTIRPVNCYSDSESDMVDMVTVGAMLFSIPFMILTIVVYLALPELRNQHGQSLACYLFGLTIGYFMLGYNNLSPDINAKDVSCKVVGYTAYYSFMAAFFWLNVISYDLWHNFCGTCGINRFQGKKRFLIFSLYAWGLAAVCLALTWYAQEKADIPEDYKPGIGDGYYCWIKMTTWSAMIYFFGPIIVIILANMVMFVATALKIHKVQREMTRIIAHEDSTANLRSEKDKIILFLRLFIVMGVTWSLEILAYLFGAEEPWSRLFYISDVCNAIQGFLIFLLFVVKKKVKELILKSDGSNQSSRTTSSRLSDKPLELNVRKG